MATKPRRHCIQSAAVLTTGTTSSGDLPNLGRDLYPNIIYVVEVTGAVTGSSPTLDIYIYAKEASGNYAVLQHLTQIIATTGTTPVRGKISDVLEDTIKIDCVVGGSASPTFNGVNVDLYFASPDA